MQLTYLEDKNLGFNNLSLKKIHSTESVLVNVINYILLTLDSGSRAILVLLD